MSYKEYENQIDPKIKWVGKIPSHWEKSKFKHNFSFSKSVNTSENPTILSLTLQGIKIRDISTNEGQIASSYHNYTKVYKGDIVLNPMDLISGFVDCSPVEGVISPAYYTLKPNKDIDPEYYKYYLQKHYYEKIFFPFAEGVSIDHRWTLKKEDFLNFNLIKPPLKEQKQIANYLDKQISKIDATIEKNNELIDLLEEKRIVLINQLVTKGLNSNVPMKESGIDWIGQIPNHWEIDSLKHRVDLNSKTLNDNTDSNYEFDYVDIGSVSLERGIEKYEHMVFEDAPSRARRIVKKDDVIISTVRTYLKAIAIIPDKENIIVSTGFAVLTPTKINSRYLGYMVKSDYFTNLVSANSVGVSYPAINSTDLINLKILIPSEEEQNEIANYLDKEILNLNNIINKVSDNIALLEEYKISLIHHVVTGKIDIRGEEI